MNPIEPHHQLAFSQRKPGQPAWSQSTARLQWGAQELCNTLNDHYVILKCNTFERTCIASCGRYSSEHQRCQHTRQFPLHCAIRPRLSHFTAPRPSTYCLPHLPHATRHQPPHREINSSNTKLHALPRPLTRDKSLPTPAAKRGFAASNRPLRSFAIPYHFDQIISPPTSRFHPTPLLATGAV